MDPNIDIDELLLDPSRFPPAPTIAYDTPVSKLVENCLRWQYEGVPFVVKGVRLDGHESPFLRTKGWQARLPRSLGECTRVHKPKNSPTNSPSGELDNGDAVAVFPCPPEWNGWLHSSYLFPTCLMPQGSDDLFPKHVDTTSCQLGVDGNGTISVPFLFPSSPHTLQQLASTMATMGLPGTTFHVSRNLVLRSSGL